jgi:hypothetical protein
MKKTSNISILPTRTVGSTPTVCRSPADNLGKIRDHSDEYVLVKVSTGEEVARYIDDGRRVPKSGDWIRLYQSFAEQLASNPKALSPMESRALWLVVAKAGFGNLARINVTAVAREWGVNRQHLSDCLSRMVARRIIERAPGGAYRLNPNFAWKGDKQTMLAVRKQWAAKTEIKLVADDDTATA